MQRKHVMILVWGLSLFLTTIACRQSAGLQAEETSDINQFVEETLSVERTQMASTVMALDITEPSATKSTETIAVSETDTTVPSAQVSENTNCRTGPGTVYDVVTVLLGGDEAEVVARSTLAEYVVIQDPENPDVSCWLWLEYALIEGDMTGLPEQAPPPTPTPAPSPTPQINFDLTYAAVDQCTNGKYRVFIKVFNTGILDIHTYALTAQDSTNQSSFSRQHVAFLTTAECETSTTFWITPGTADYVFADFDQPVSGHSFTITLEGCTENYAEPCQTKTVSFTIP